MATLNNYKYIGEFRYKPVPKVIDIRGEIADTLVTSNLSQWKISKDRVDVFDKDQTSAVFIGYQNCGFAFENKDNTQEILSVLQQGLKKLPAQSYSRIGIRITAVVESRKQFKSLVRSFKEKLMDSDFFVSAPQKLTLKDVGFTYIFTSDDDEVQIHIGPMDRSQAKSFFSNDKKIPKTGIFIDIDCYKQLSVGSNFRDIKRFVHFAKPKIDKLRDFCVKSLESENK